MDLNSLPDQFWSLNFYVCVRIPFFLPTYLLGCSSALRFMLGIGCCITDDDDLIHFRQGVNMIETNFYGFIAPASVDSDFVQKLDQVSWFGLKIRLFQKKFWTRIIISVDTDLNLEWPVDLSMLQSIVQSWEGLLNHILHFVEDTLHRRCAVQCQNSLANKISNQRLLIEFVYLLNHFFSWLALCV